MASSIWQQIDQLKAEHDKTKLLVRAVKGGRFRGRKPNGDWHVRIGGDVGGTDVVRPTPVELVLAVAAERCWRCGHELSDHSMRELEGEELKGKRHKEKKRCCGVTKKPGFVLADEEEPCGCHLTPEEIRERQTSREAIAQRLASLMRQRSATEDAARDVTADTVFAGLRGPAEGERHDA
ncbi:hypothetical protein [Myxococcus phage Mx4 ts27htf-1hrm-1]|nr:hypothetical protein Mx4_p18 [Myxococcus phage Mx4]WNM70359.1 hypothetical protein [Myxococcus phage Mx4 ts27htf-1hrm-1]